MMVQEARLTEAVQRSWLKQQWHDSSRARKVAFVRHTVCLTVGGMMGLGYLLFADGAISHGEEFLLAGSLAAGWLEAISAVPAWVLVPLYGKFIKPEEQAKAESAAKTENKRLKQALFEADAQQRQLAAKAGIAKRVQEMIEQEVPWTMIEKTAPWVVTKIKGIEAYLTHFPVELHQEKDKLRVRVLQLIKDRFAGDIDTDLVDDPSQSIPYDLSGWGIKLIKRIGGGGLGDAYSALHDKYGPVVIKFLKSKFIVKGEDEGEGLAVRRFRNEVKLQLEFNKKPHPNVVHIFDYDINETAPFLVMQYVRRGLPLSKLIKQNGSLDLRGALTVLYFMVEALEAAQKLGIIHRDVTPQNIMLTADEAFLKLIDFGSAKGAESKQRFVSREWLWGILRLDKHNFKLMVRQLFVEVERGGDDLKIIVEKEAIEAALQELVLNQSQLTILRELLNKKLDKSLTQPMHAEPAKAGYCAPEYGREDVPYEAEYLRDVFALGVVFYEVLVGQKPHPEAPPRVVDYMRWLGEKIGRKEPFIEYGKMPSFTAGISKEVRSSVRHLLDDLTKMTWQEREKNILAYYPEDQGGVYSNIKRKTLEILRQL